MVDSMRLNVCRYIRNPGFVDTCELALTAHSQLKLNVQAVFFKMRVAGVLHIFQFETRQGEDICTALQTHINDIMMKRYSKAKQSSGERTLPQANFGPKYEQHVSSIQKSLEEAKQKLSDVEKSEQQLLYERVWPPQPSWITNCNGVQVHAVTSQHVPLVRSFLWFLEHLNCEYAATCSHLRHRYHGFWPWWYCSLQRSFRKDSSFIES